MTRLTPPNQEPQQKSRIDVSRTVNDIARGVKRTPPRYSLAPEVWKEECMVYIQPAPGNAILSVEICNDDGLPVYEASIDGASGEETFVSPRHGKAQPNLALFSQLVRWHDI